MGDKELTTAAARRYQERRQSARQQQASEHTWTVRDSFGREQALSLPWGESCRVVPEKAPYQRPDVEALEAEGWEIGNIMSSGDGVMLYIMIRQQQRPDDGRAVPIRRAPRDHQGEE